MVAEMGNAKEGLAGGIIKDDGKKEENKVPEALKGASHASDIEYLLGNLSGNKVYAWTSDDYKASEIAEEYIANFIKTGNPNAKKLPDWPVSKPDGDLNIMMLNVTAKATKEQYRDRYLFLDKYYQIKK